MALAVADAGCSILDISIVECHQSVAVNYILLTVPNLEKLELVMKKIQNLDVIVKVWRVDGVDHELKND